MYPILAEVSTVSSTDFMSVITALQEQISVANIVSILAIGAGIGVGFVFMWWGVRKLIGVLMNAFKKSKLKI